MKLEIERTLVVSTAHITRRDVEMLGLPNALPCSVDGVNGGWLVLVEEDWKAQRAAMQKAGCSEGFMRLIALAMSKDCQRLRLDMDGPKLDGWPVHHW